MILFLNFSQLFSQFEIGQFQLSLHECVSNVSSCILISLIFFLFYVFSKSHVQVMIFLSIQISKLRLMKFKEIFLGFSAASISENFSILFHKEFTIILRFFLYTLWSQIISKVFSSSTMERPIHNVNRKKGKQ